MATSGSTDFTLNRNEIVTDALILLGVLGADQTISGEDNDVAVRALNRMIKQWQVRGINLFGTVDATVFLDGSSQSYDLYSSGDHASTTVVETTIDAAEALGQTTLSVTSTTGMTIGDYAGIELDDGTRQWTTIASISAGVSITVNDALTAAAAVGNTVYTYTTRLPRPLNILSMQLRDESGLDNEVCPISLEDYRNMYDKASTGTVSQYAYKSDLTKGVLYVWPVSDNVVDRLKITVYRTLEDMDSSTDNFDFPVEWLDAITYNLAVRLAPVFNRVDQLDVIAPLAERFLEEALQFNTENNQSIFISYGE